MTTASTSPSPVIAPSGLRAAVAVNPHAELVTSARGRHPATKSDSSRVTRTTLLLTWLAGLIICCGWDRAVWLAASASGKPTLAWLEAATSLGGLSRIASERGVLGLLGALTYAATYFFGRMWIWLALAIVLIFRSWSGTSVDRVRRGLREGVFVVLVPALAGLMAEVIKLITRRQRPEAADGVWSFQAPRGSMLDPEYWSTSGLGLASSHAAVALGAALAAGVVFPKLRPWLYALALACCLGRLVVGAHYLSDVYVGGSVALVSFVLLRAWDARNNQGRPLRAHAA